MAYGRGTKTRIPWAPIAAALALVLALGGAGGWYYWTGTVEYTLLQLSKAIREHNRYLFEKHVDLDPMVRLAVDEFFSREMERMKNEPMAPVEAMMADAGMTFAQLFKPRMVEEVRFAIIKGVESGKLERGNIGTQRRAGENEDLDSALKEMANEFPVVKPVHLGKIYRQGAIATVELSVDFDDDLPEKLPPQTLLVRFVRTPDRYWRATEVENFKEILRRWKEREDKRLELANEPARKMLREMVSVSGLRKEQGLDVFGTGKDAWVVATFRNNAGSGIDGIEADVVIRDEGGVIKRVRVRNIEPIGEGKALDKTWAMGLDLEDEADREIYDAKAADLKMDLELRRIVLSDGRDIRIADSLDEVEQQPARPRKNASPKRDIPIDSL